MSDAIEKQKLELLRARLDAELRVHEESLSFQREKWEAQRDFRRKPTFEFKAWQATVVAAVFGLLGTAIGAYLQGRTNVTLEREKFRSNLLLKAFEAPSRSEVSKYLQFIRVAGLVPDLPPAIDAIIQTPDSLPLLSPVQTQCLDFTLDELNTQNRVVTPYRNPLTDTLRIKVESLSGIITVVPRVPPWQSLTRLSTSVVSLSDRVLIRSRGNYHQLFGAKIGVGRIRVECGDTMQEYAVSVTR